jgi:hypothetical protein
MYSKHFCYDEIAMSSRLKLDRFFSDQFCQLRFKDPSQVIVGTFPGTFKVV